MRREMTGAGGRRRGSGWKEEQVLSASKVYKAPHLSDSLDNTVDVCDDSPYNTFDSPSARWVAEANTETIPGPYRAPIGWLSCQGAQIPSI